VVRRADADDVLFLAGGVAFNVLLAAVPFLLLIGAGLGYLLDQSPTASFRIAQTVLETLLPARFAQAEPLLDPVLADVVRTRAVVGLGGGIGFLWFSTRLFASLRLVMSMVFNHGRERGFVRGKLWDLHLTFTSVVLMLAWVALSAWLTVTTGRLGAALARAGLLQDAMGSIEYAVTRALAVTVVVTIFFALYRWLPRTRTPVRVALTGAVTAAALFEVARALFGWALRTFPPSSVYTGTLGAVFIVVFWTYYAALIFVLGAEVAHTEQDRLAGTLGSETPAPTPAT